eukprot:CAMPEP_0116069732 /NCGR_PEP_ID=MMETSP0322-20121206/12499_1 /TAXON_ID=163516 /ORGANISM="Leptocylindrus danicus var. apora, Strain B651" /LENGTH=269 /DNA_ID=CAMNT_0003557225 /DNA_START=1 /DNA_END=810 /DNA_ORIENTATION=-
MKNYMNRFAMSEEFDKEEQTLNEETEEPEVQRKRKRKPHKIDLNELQNDFNVKLSKRGVVYLARVPPRMGPTKVKLLLSQFGTVTRVYLVEEDRAARKRRRKAAGGNAGGKRYIEGWIEFEDKKVAKSVGNELNGTPISNRKRDVHCGELWSVKYLRNFKWSHLTEKVAYERRVREQKLRVEMMHAKREHAAYAKLVEAGEIMDRIQHRRESRRDENLSSEQTLHGLTSPKRRKIRQSKPIAEEDQDGTSFSSTRKKKTVSSAVLGSLS